MVGHARALTDEAQQSENSSHPFSVISREGTTEDCKVIREVCLYGHGRLDLLGISCAMDDSITRHCCCCLSEEPTGVAELIALYR